MFLCYSSYIYSKQFSISVLHVELSTNTMEQDHPMGDSTINIADLLEWANHQILWVRLLLAA